MICVNLKEVYTAVKIYIVKKGDTLYKLSQTYNVDLDQLIAMNPLIADPDYLVVGLKVKIPDPAPVELSPDLIQHTHTVKQGDSLWKLAKAWGVPLQMMIKANPHLKSPHALLTGETVYIPDMEKVMAASQTAEQISEPVEMQNTGISDEAPSQNVEMLEESQSEIEMDTSTLDDLPAMDTGEVNAPVEKPSNEAGSIHEGGVSPMDVQVPTGEQEQLAPDLFQPFQIPATEAFDWNPGVNMNIPIENLGASDVNTSAPPQQGYEQAAENAPWMNSMQPMQVPDMMASAPLGAIPSWFDQFHTGFNAAAHAYANLDAQASFNTSANFYALSGPDMMTPYMAAQAANEGMAYVPQMYHQQPVDALYGMPSWAYPNTMDLGYGQQPWMHQAPHGDCGCGGAKPRVRSQERYAITAKKAHTESSDETANEANEDAARSEVVSKAKKKPKAQVKSQKKKTVSHKPIVRKQGNHPWINA